MKKISILAMLLMGVSVFTACNTDRDDNPVLGEPTSFEMLAPAVSGITVDLVNSESIELRAKSRPEYGAPVAVTFGAQIALSETTNEEEIYTLEATGNDITYDAVTSDINKGIMILKGIESESDFVDEPIDLYVRMSARLADLDGAQKIYSNWQKLSVLPYFLALADEEPIYWWLIGGCIGDGTWTNNAKGEGVYKAVFPIPLVKEYEYSGDGTGAIAITLYVPDGGIFKMIQTLGDWNVQVGMNGGEFAYNDGGSGNIEPTDGAGFYRLEFDTKSGTVMSYTKVDAPSSTYETVGIIGLYGDWDNDIDMTPAAGAGENNHMWTAIVDVTEDTMFKMRANHDWGVNWGYGAYEGEVNTYGFCTNGGQNIGITAGKWAFYLDDITGFFRVVPVVE